MTTEIKVGDALVTIEGSRLIAGRVRRAIQLSAELDSLAEELDRVCDILPTGGSQTPAKTIRDMIAEIRKLRQTVQAQNAQLSLLDTFDYSGLEEA